MPSHPIDQRAEQYIREEWKAESEDEQWAFRGGARFGYDAALADRAKVDAAKDAIVAYVRTLAEAQDVMPTASRKLIAALDAAEREAGRCPNG